MASYNKQESSSSPFESALSNLFKQHGGIIHIVVDNAITPSDELIDRVLDYEEDYSSSSREEEEETTENVVGRALSILQKEDSIEKGRISATTGGDIAGTCPHHKDKRWEASPTCSLMSPVRRLSLEIHHHHKGSRISSPPLDVTMHHQSSKYY